MFRVGTVIRTAQGLAIARSAEDPSVDIGTEVLGEDLETVGTVVEVFGPVDEPYVAIDPTDDTHIPDLLGGPVYAR